MSSGSLTIRRASFSASSSLNGLSEKAKGVRRLSVHMGKRQAIGIDDPIAARDRLKSPGSGKRR
jgi:hypothetical protein